MQQHTWPFIYGMLEVSDVEHVADYWTNVATSRNHVKFGRLIEKCEIVKIHTCALVLLLDFEWKWDKWFVFKTKMYNYYWLQFCMLVFYVLPHLVLCEAMSISDGSHPSLCCELLVVTKRGGAHVILICIRVL